MATSPNEGLSGEHGRMREFPVIHDQPSHPILKGLPTEWMHAEDELYGSLRGPVENIEVLAHSYCRQTSENEPMMIITYGKGKIFHIPMGHWNDEFEPFGAALHCVGFQTVLARGTEYVATGKVTIGIPSSFPSKEKTSVIAPDKLKWPGRACPTSSTPPVKAPTPESVGIPLPEHPRPDFHRDVWVNLNGQWDFSLDPDETGENDGWFNDTSSFDRKITVPFSWAAPLSGIGEWRVDVGWYARKLEIPEDGAWKSKRIFIVIGASDFGTKLWLNGEFVGEHEGGYTPFEFDLTDDIDRTGTNRLVIRVEDKRVRGRQTGKQGYGAVKGIWQTGYLEARPETHIRLAHFSPDIDNKKVGVKIELSEAAGNDLDLSVSFKDKSVKSVLHEIAAGQNEIEFDIPIPNQQLWTLDNPYLYDVDLALSDGGEEKDRVHSYFGMRKIGMARLPDSKDMYITLNNKPIYLSMALDQSYNPEGYFTFPSDEFMKEEILRAKDIGLNGIRIHIKTGIPRKLYWADKLGLLIQADIPNFGAHDDRGIPSEYARKHWEYTFRNQVARDYNHPSIFSWVLFNETWGMEGRGRDSRGYHPESREWVRSLYYLAKELDPTRLVEDNSPDKNDHIVSDINSWHRYLPAQIYASYLDDIIEKTYPGSGWNYVGDNKQTDIPLLNTECGAEHGYNDQAGDIDMSFEYHIMVNAFRKRLKNAGFVFTQFHDVIDEWNGYYRYDRGAKEWGLDDLCPGMTVRDLHSDMYLIPGDDFFKIVTPGENVTMPITASFTTNDVPDQMSVKTVVHGWDRFGEHQEYATSKFSMKPKPFQVFDVGPVTLKAPNEEALLIFCTYLMDDEGDTVNRNFIPFRVIAEDRRDERDSEQIIVRLAPDDFSDSDWSIRQMSVLDGLKVSGTGTGYFEYEFSVPEDIAIEDIQDVEFLAELSARHVQSKYSRPRYTQGDSEGDREEDEEDDDGGCEEFEDPSYRYNSYAMTDPIKHTSRVTITLNGANPQTVTLDDDPADHRGLLSWLNQIRPKSLAVSDYRERDWKLEDAGSYGYRVSKKFDRQAIERALDEKVFRIKLAVDESSDTSGGLAVYGEKFGRYPLGPTVIIRMK